ncbi:hypothetical protein CDL15_Pgr022606 [Punica granatum]|uniref:Uncharacterized protein n=1 Tax=Punica granatum TaxID=22663 RepID=A0A218XQN8_PUNGR|nr:hypothetical protein CDL15_Pgr022606 [Punica granatum]
MSVYRNMDLPWFDQVDKSSSSRNNTHKHQDLPPKKRFCVKSGLTAWRPDHRQQLISDDLWSSVKHPQKGEESINALVLHMEEQSNSKESLQQELCLKIDLLQQELSLQKSQTQAFLQDREKDALDDENKKLKQDLESISTPSINQSVILPIRSQT